MKIQRYRILSPSKPEPHHDGEWVKWADARRLFTHSIATTSCATLTVYDAAGKAVSVEKLPDHGEA
jgi:hypothetical protein